MKKGLRPNTDGTLDAVLRPKTSPDEKGIKTRPGQLLRHLVRVQRPPLMKKGLRPQHRQSSEPDRVQRPPLMKKGLRLRHQDMLFVARRPKTSPDEKGIKTFSMSNSM